MQARYTNELTLHAANRPDTQDKDTLRQGRFVILTSSFKWLYLLRKQYHYNEHNVAKLPTPTHKYCHGHGCVVTHCAGSFQFDNGHPWNP